MIPMSFYVDFALDMDHADNKDLLIPTSVLMKHLDFRFDVLEPNTTASTTITKG